MKLSAIRSRTRGLDIDLGDGDMVHIDYRVHYLNEETVKQLDEIQANDDNKVRKSIELLCLLVKSWDVEDDKGKVMPLDTDALLKAGMTVDVAWALMNAMLEDIKVGEAKSAS